MTAAARVHLNADGTALCPRTRKVMFRDPGVAEKQRLQIKRRHNDRQNVYRCSHCRFWHLGHGLR